MGWEPQRLQKWSDHFLFARRPLELGFYYCEILTNYLPSLKLTVSPKNWCLGDDFPFGARPIFWSVSFEEGYILSLLETVFVSKNTCFFGGVPFKREMNDQNLGSFAPPYNVGDQIWLG